MRNYPVPEGDFISQANVTSKSPVAVLGANVAQELFTNGQDPVGQAIRINNIPFRVVGVLVSQGRQRLRQPGRPDPGADHHGHGPAAA